MGGSIVQPLLHPRQNGGGEAREVASGYWRLEIPPGPQGKYRLAQLDDYMNLPRARFPHHAPLRLELRARASAADLTGTWGFGLWNDPFTASLGLGGMGARVPALPNAAWFFSAGEGNYLAFRDDHPAQGFLAATFAARRIPSLLLAPGALALPLLAVPALARLARRAVRELVRESAALARVDVTAWHTYRLDWLPERASFFIDGVELAATPVSPRGPQGLVLWIDNQFAAFPPSGRVSIGASANPRPAWLELEGISLERLATSSGSTA